MLGAGGGEYSSPVFNDDYERLFPEDAYGQETGPNARVWRAYEQEAATYDAAMIGQSRDGLDVMLVFAGLFSAVVTSFLVQVSQNLQPDFQEMTALLLHDIVVMQIQAGDASSANITIPSADPSAGFEPDTLDVWMNGLWAASLTASLVVALSAVLIKQWLHRYMTLPSGTPGLRSHIRHFRFVGFEKWHVEAIIGTLPVIMHMSLALFLVGLILFFIPLRLSLAYSIGVISIGVLVLYISTNVMPLFHPQCPYQTPLTDFFPYLIKVLTSIGRKIGGSSFTRKATDLLTTSLLARLGVVHTFLGTTSRMPKERTAGALASNILMSTRQREAKAAQSDYDVISVDALHWVFHMTANPTLHNLVVHAVAGLPSTALGHAEAVYKDDEELRLKRNTLLKQVTKPDAGRWPFQICRPGREVEMERLCRSILALPLADDHANSHSISLMTAQNISAEFPRLQATLWLARRVVWRTGNVDPSHPVQEVTSVIASIQHAPIHLLLWRALVFDALTRAAENEDALLWPKVLPVVLFDPDISTSSELPAVLQQEVQVMTLPQAVRSSELRQQVFAFLYETPILRQFDCVSSHDLSVELRVAIAMWKLAVRRLAEPDREFSAPYYRVLHYAMSRIGVWENPLQLRLPDIPLLLELIQSVVGSTFFTDEGFGTSEFEDNCVQEVLRHYREVALADDTFAYPSFRRLVDGGMRYMLSGPDAIVASSTFPVFLTIHIMEEALKRGREEAYRVFVDRDWMKVVYEIPTNDMRGPCGDVLEAFIEGMGVLPAGERRAEYLDFLFQPRNLTMACVSLLLMWQDRHIPALHALSPSHSSWAEVHATLIAVRDWSRHTEEDTALSFPLENLVGRKILQASDYSVLASLDEEVREMLRKDDHMIDNFLDVLERCMTQGLSP